MTYPVDAGRHVRSQASVSAIRSFGHVSARHKLTRTELEVLECLANGLTRPEVAALRVVQLTTINHHTINAFRKLNVGSLVQAMNVLGWVEVW